MLSEYSVPAEMRFWIKVDKRGEQDCWPWLASKTKFGHGQFYSCGAVRGAHIFAYELQYGKVPEGQEIHHICKNPSCVNPLHLTPLTKSKHTSLQFLDITHCKRSHAFTPDNTGHYKNGGRYCKLCRKASCSKTESTRPPRLRAEYQKMRYHTVPGVAERRRADQRLRNKAERVAMKLASDTIHF